jgi:thiamine-phosphate pyrophosphorylase
MSTDKHAIRILDASLNRASEGLRVAEDYVRFVLDDRHLTEQLKKLRHDVAAAGAALPLPHRHAARDTRHDVGATVSTPSEIHRADSWTVCIASFERVKQSLRSLEEYGKLAKAGLGEQFESLRYRLYIIEAAVGRTVDAVERLDSVRLYVLIDGCESEASFIKVAEQLVAAGVDAIQLRAKNLIDRHLIARARLLRSLALQPESASHRPLVVINDRPDIAAIVDADGVHLGQEDMSIKDARTVVGPGKLVGVSCHSIEQARAAVLDGANYIGVGPTFPSSTKKFEAFPGVELLRQVAAEVRLPAFAIGGINSNNVNGVLSAGITRIAVGSAVINAAYPGHEATRFRAALSQ